MKSHNLDICFEDMIQTTIKIEENFDLLVYKPTIGSLIYIPRKKNSEKLIHFILCSSGTFELQIGSEHHLTFGSDQFIITYNTPSIIFTQENTQLFVLQIELKKFHRMILNQSDLLDFLFKSDEIKKPIFKVARTYFLHCSIAKQITQSLHSKSELVYLKAKTYELVSMLTHFLTKNSGTACPYFLDQDAIKKLEQAKNILENNIVEPPLTSELSEQVHLSLQKLNKGFKKVYGISIQDYLINRRMIVSQELLISKKYTVKEIALRVGYSTSSHFIAAFKKKFGTTPKKYVMRLN